MEEALNLGKKSSSVVEDVVVADHGVVQGEKEEAVDERTPLLKHWITPCTIALADTFQIFIFSLNRWNCWNAEYNCARCKYSLHNLKWKWKQSCDLSHWGRSGKYSCVSYSYSSLRFNFCEKISKYEMPIKGHFHISCFNPNLICSCIV